jgi:ABC-type branched-subunit amino acid transport system ATPase component
MDENPLLRLEALSKSFGGISVLDRLDLTIGSGSLVGMIGPNGSGKSTLINLVSGFLRPDSGRIRFRERDLTPLRPHAIARAGIGRTYQEIRIFPQVSVWENLALAFESRSRERLRYALWPFRLHSNEEARARSVEMLSTVDLDSHVDVQAGTLSHGQRRLLAILRAVARDASLYLFDEPTSGVFPGIRDRILSLFQRLQAQGKSVLFIEHDMDTVRQGAERVVLLDRGTIRADGETDEVLSSDIVRSAYFGNSDPHGKLTNS